MKKVILIASIVSLGLFAGAFVVAGLSADAGKSLPSVDDAVKQCFEKKCFFAKSGENCTPTEASITDFYCPQGGLSMEDTAYQVALDIRFRQIDQKVEKWFEQLTGSEAKGKTPAELMLMIDKQFGALSGSGFYKQYMDVCDNIVVGDVLKRFENLTTSNGIKSVIRDASQCHELASKKAQAYRTASWTVATQNMVENYRSDKKEFTDKLKEQYRNMLEKFAVYVAKLSKIEKKWDKVTKTVQ